jgi:hypothetical protein
MKAYKGVDKKFPSGKKIPQRIRRKIYLGMRK